MPLPLKIILGVWVLLLVVVVLVVVHTLRRRRRGRGALETRGWTRLPEATGLVSGWVGWPFVTSYEPGRASDGVVGELQGCRFMAFTWHYRRPDGDTAKGELERCSVVALATEQSYPRLKVVKGWRGFGRGPEQRGLPDVELGDPRLDRTWEVRGDEQFARALLTPEVLEVVDRVGESLSVQPGWVVRVVTPWAFFAGEDRMVEELQKLAAPFRAVPAETWAAYGGAPRFVGVLGHLPQGG